MRTGTIFSFSILLIVISAPAVFSSVSVEAFNYPALFQSNELLELSVKFEHKKVIKDVGDEREYHDARIFFTSQYNIQDSINVRIRTRGHFRRDPMNCDFPPLMLNFKKTDTENTIFEGLSNMFSRSISYTVCIICSRKKVTGCGWCESPSSM